MMVLVSGKARVAFWIAIASGLLVASYVMFLAFNPRIGNSLVTILVIILVWAVGVVGACHKFKLWGWFSPRRKKVGFWDRNSI
jgi:uncharacterized membrane protein HdeD (DUF308 family)